MAARRYATPALLLLQIILLDSGVAGAYYSNVPEYGGQLPRGPRPRSWDYEEAPVGPAVVLPEDLLYRRRPRVIQVPLLLKYDYPDLEDYPERSGDDPEEVYPSAPALQGPRQYRTETLPPTGQHVQDFATKGLGRQRGHFPEPDLSEVYPAQIPQSPRQYRTQTTLLSRDSASPFRQHVQEFATKGMGRQRGNIPEPDLSEDYPAQRPRQYPPRTLLGPASPSLRRPYFQPNLQDFPMHDLVRQRRFDDVASDYDADSSDNALKYERLRNSMRYQPRKHSDTPGGSKPGVFSRKMEANQLDDTPPSKKGDDNMDVVDLDAEGDDAAKEDYAENAPIVGNSKDPLPQNHSTQAREKQPPTYNKEEEGNSKNNTVEPIEQNKAEDNKELNINIYQDGDRIQKAAEVPQSKVSVDGKKRRNRLKLRFQEVDARRGDASKKLPSDEKSEGGVVLGEVSEAEHMDPAPDEEEPTPEKPGQRKKKGRSSAKNNLPQDTDTDLIENDEKSNLLPTKDINRPPKETIQPSENDQEVYDENGTDINQLEEFDNNESVNTSYTMLMKPSEITEAKDKLETIYELIHRFRILGKAYSKNFLKFIQYKVSMLYRKLKPFPNAYEELDMEDGVNVDKLFQNTKILFDISKYRFVRKLYFKNMRQLVSVYEPSLFSAPPENDVSSEEEEEGEGEESDGILTDMLANVRSSMDVALHLANQVDAILNLIMPSPEPMPKSTRQAKVFLKHMLFKYVPAVTDITKATKQNKDRGDANDKAFMVLTLAQHRLLGILFYKNLYTLLSAINKVLPEHAMTSKPSEFKRAIGARFLPKETDFHIDDDSNLKTAILESSQSDIKQFSDSVAQQFAQYVAQQVEYSFNTDAHYLFRYPLMAMNGYNELETDDVLKNIMTKKAKDIINKLNLKALLFESGIRDDKSGLSHNYAMKEATKAILKASVPITIDSGKQTLKKEATKLISTLTTNNSVLQNVSDSGEGFDGEDYEPDTSKPHEGYRRFAGHTASNSVEQSGILNQYKPLDIESIEGGFQVGNDKIHVYDDILKPALNVMKSINIIQHENHPKSSNKSKKGKPGSLFLPYVTAKLIQDLMKSDPYKFENESLDADSKMAVVLAHYYLSKKAEDLRELGGARRFDRPDRSAPHITDDKFSQLDIDATPAFMGRKFTRLLSPKKRGKFGYHPRRRPAGKKDRE